MSILKKQIISPGENQVFLKNPAEKKRALKLSLLPWNSKLMAPTGDSANKISCTKVHITPEKSVKFSGLRKCC